MTAPEVSMMDMDETVIQSEVNNDGCVLETKTPAKRKYTHSTTTRLDKYHKSRNVRWEHIYRNEQLLSALLRQHNWKEAAGVLSVLFKGTCRERFPMKNREKYRVAMELLNKASGDQIKPTSIKHIYEVWMKKNGSMKKWPPEDKYSVPLEYALFCFLRGDIVEAKDAIMSLKQERDHGNDPVFNTMVGLMYYELWYATIPEEMKLRSFDICEIPTQSEVSGMESYHPAEYSDFRSAVNVHGVESPAQCHSELSVANYRDDNPELGDDTQTKADTQTKPSNQVFKSQGFYMDESAEVTGNEEVPIFKHNENVMNTSIFHSRGLDVNLLPIRLPDLNENMEDYIGVYMETLNDYYANAVDYLRSALNSTPPALASLLPLIQLLLLGDRVVEAVNELENLWHSTNAVLPLRLKAILLDCFGGKESVGLSTCYEDILKIDPTCSRSITRLITMHRNGEYNLEKLIGMIALHLDATTNASSSIWEELASCFLKFSQFQEDQMSIYEKANEDAGKSYHISFSTFPQTLVQGMSRKSWKLRYKWWSKQHFSYKAHISEMRADDLQLSASKAACASHLYGPEFEYVAYVHAHLQNAELSDNLLFLQLHMKNSINLFERMSGAE